MENRKKLQDARTSAKIMMIEQSSLAGSELFNTNTELAYRAVERFGKDIVRTQANREEIVMRFIDNCLVGYEGKVKNREISPDWLYQYWKTVEGISEESTQSILAKFLVEEIFNPGITSIQAISTFISMSDDDMESFSKLANLSITYDDDCFVIHPDVIAFKNIGPLDEYGVKLDDVLNLEFLRLIRSIDCLGTSYEGSFEKVNYAGREIVLDVSEGTDKIVFTPNGKRLRDMMTLVENPIYTAKLKSVLGGKIQL